MSDSRYWDLRVLAGADVCEGLTNFLWELGAIGVVEESAGSDVVPALRAFFPGTTAPATLEAGVREYLHDLRSLGFTVLGEPTVAALADENWVSAWREHFRPLPVGESLLIAPPWETLPVNGRLTIIVDPGRAFGTGHHGTTRGCLEALEAIVARDMPASAIDLGAGSGILAIALARLGVPHVLAVDEDPDALAATIENATRSGVAARVTCRLADAGALEEPPAPLVVANLLTAAHRRLAPCYARDVAPGGRLVLGGILDVEAHDVLGAVCPQGFAPQGAVSIEGWTTLVLARLVLARS